MASLLPQPFKPSRGDRLCPGRPLEVQQAGETLQRPEDKEEEIWDHVEELVIRLKRVVKVFIVATLILSFIPAPGGPAYSPLVAELPKILISHAVPQNITWMGKTYEVALAQFSPMAGFNILFKSAILLGIIASSPVAIRETFEYIRPALYPHEERIVKRYTAVGIILFLAGLALAYYFIIPIAFRFMFITSLVVAGEQGLIAFADVERLFTLAIQLMLATGILFEVPLVVYALLAAGVISPEFFTGERMKYAFVASLILGAIISPDPSGLGMLFIAIPYYLLFYIAVKLGIRAHKSRSPGTPGASDFLQGEDTH